MSGTKTGGLKASQTMKAKYGDDWYAKLGQMGGSAPRETPRYFEAHPEVASEAGRKGGRVSRRKKPGAAMDYEAEHHKDSAKSFLKRIFR